MYIYILVSISQSANKIMSNSPIYTTFHTPHETVAACFMRLLLTVMSEGASGSRPAQSLTGEGQMMMDWVCLCVCVLWSRW